MTLDVGSGSRGYGIWTPGDTSPVLEMILHV